MARSTLRQISMIYLLMIPFAGSALAFGVGHVSYTLYLPIWILNAVAMVMASWNLGLHIGQSADTEAGKLARSAFLFIVPWILISMFAGLGPPPTSASAWTDTATEQQVRYFMLVICGVFIALGFTGLRERLQTAGETFYARLSWVIILIAIPLFILNMLYWGFYLTAFFKIQSSTQATTYPDWFQPIRQLFGIISVVEVALTYAATFLLVMAFKKVQWISTLSANLYLGFSSLAFVIIILSAFFTEAFAVPGFAVSIPASPLLMPYFIGIHLLRKAGDPA